MSIIEIGVFSFFNLCVISCMGKYYYVVCVKLQNEGQQKSKTPSNVKWSVNSEIPWHHLGDQPAYGDLSDLGAVDVALKIKDLQGFKDDAKNAQEKAYYRQKIMEQCSLLTDLTLVQVAPLPIVEEEQFIQSPPENLIPFGKAKAFRKDNHSI